MQTLRLYTSSPASTKLADLALGLERPGQPVVLLPLTQLPTGPQPRRLSLRVELHDLRQKLLAVEKAQANVAAGLYYEDPAGLAYEQNALQTRLQGIERALGQLHGAAAESGPG